MKVLIVGANGFLGKAIARIFLENKSEVWAVFSNNKDSIPKGCQIVHIDDVDTLEKDFDVVVLAAGNHSLSPKSLLGANIALTSNMVECFPDSMLIYISSVAVYGNHQEIINEKSTFNNPLFYGLAKLSGEAVAQTHSNYAILRLTYLYGAEMPTNSFLPTIINKAKKDKKIVLYGKGERMQDYLHVDDAANLCYQIADRKLTGIYLGATGQSISNTKVAEIIQTIIHDCEITYTGIDNAPWFLFDPSYTQDKAKWMPKFIFDDVVSDWLVS